MSASEPTLQSVLTHLDLLRETARRIYAQHQAAAGVGDGWSREDYLAGVDELEEAIKQALSLPRCTHARFEAEKYARNILANRLYFRGRLCLRTGTLGRFYKKVGDKGIDWAPTELSRMADRLAAEPLRHVYKRTEACL